MLKQSRHQALRGWEAIKLQMKQEGFNKFEIDEAEESFRNGIEVLAKLFHVTYPLDHKNLRK